jgi:serine/threonine protein kinase
MRAELWKKVEELYQAALAKAPADRAAFLAQACPDDPQVRGEVQSLLDQKADSFLESAPLPAIQALKPGDMLGSFQIVSSLGRGGMGEVYRARDLRLKREVAIKTLPPVFAADRDRLARFEREARVAAAINHPNICTVYEVGSHNGVDFIAMEFVEGKTLGEIIPARGLPLEKVLDCAVQMASGLARAHAAGVVHRDLKPGNIMLSGDGLVKLLDFGLAGRVELGEGHDTTLTVEGQIYGTPSYMSPEQAQGKPVDVRSDVFSFGSVLYRW